MIYIDSTPSPSGAYPNAKSQPFPGCIPLTDKQAEVFFAYNGFVVVDGNTVTPNEEAWEAWKASQTTEELLPTITTEERIAELEKALELLLSGVTE